MSRRARAGERGRGSGRASRRGSSACRASSGRRSRSSDSPSESRASASAAAPGIGPGRVSRGQHPARDRRALRVSAQPVAQVLGQLEAPERPARITARQLLHVVGGGLGIAFVEGMDLVELDARLHPVESRGPGRLLDGAQAARAVSAGQAREEAEEAREAGQHVDVVVVEAEAEEHVRVLGILGARGQEVLAHLGGGAGRLRALRAEEVMAAAHAAGRPAREARACVVGVGAQLRVREAPGAVRRLLQLPIARGRLRLLLDDPGQGQGLEVERDGIVGDAASASSRSRAWAAGAPAVIEKIEGGAVLPVRPGEAHDAGGQEEGRRGDQR